MEAIAAGGAEIVNFPADKDRMAKANMLNNFRKLLAYNEWANYRVLESLLAMSPTPSEAVRFFAHVLAAEHLWHRRLTQQPTDGIVVWPKWTIEQCALQLTEMSGRWDRFVPELSPEWLMQTVSYANSKGEKWQNTVSDVLSHVIMHSGYHRGQVAADVRASGGEPAYTDYIHAVRRGFVATSVKA